MLKRVIMRSKEFCLPIYGGIPTADIGTILQSAGPLDVRLEDWQKDQGAGSLWDLLAVCMLAKHLRPKVCFEIGTGHGRTTHHLALNTPDDTVIHTLDVSDGDVVGSIFRGRETAGKIRQIKGDSTQFDFGPWKGQVGLVVVDGDHGLRGVENDTARAFELVAPDGVIIWDDFTPDWPGVIGALKNSGRRAELRRIGGTKLVLGRPTPPAANGRA